MTDSKDLRMRGTTAVDISDTAGTIHPFLTSHGSCLNILSRELRSVIMDPQAKRILGLASLNILSTVVLLFWCNTTNSMALTAYTYLAVFDIFRLFTCLVTVWVQQQKPSPIFSFGYERFEVLAIFASTLLAQFGSLFIVKESIERMFQQPDVHTGRLLIATAVAFSSHIHVTYRMDNRAFNHIIAASSSSWLQEHVSDISESICNVVPGISKLLLPRINPFALISVAGATALLFVYLLIDIRNFYSADTCAALWIAMMTCGTMFPMSVYSGKILLQTTPSHIIGQLDKSIREASTLDGVLEFRHEHFWTLSFGTMAGSVHVRVRRDADEQLVLAHVYNRLSNNVIVLTVQIFKDDWSRPSSMHILNSLSSFGSSSPTSASGSSRAQSPPPTTSYKSIQRSTSPFGGLGLPPVLIPSRTDPAYVDSMSGPTSPNIPAMRLAANAPANNTNLTWARQDSPEVSYERTHPRGINDCGAPSSQVVSMGNIGSSYLGSGLSMGNNSYTANRIPTAAYPDSSARHSQTSSEPQQGYRTEQNNPSQSPKKSIGKQT